MNAAYERPTLLIAFVIPVLMLGALNILGSAIGWPDSLDLPPQDALPNIAAHLGAVRLGYGLYFAASALHVGLALCLAFFLGARRRPLLALAAAAGAASGLFKILGIARWLEAMPQLATRFQTDPEAAALIFHTLNDYAGVTLGEGLGTALFAGLFYGLFALGAGRSVADDELSLPPWLRGLFGITALISLWTFAGLFGAPADAARMLSGYFQYFGLWFLAGWMLLRHRFPPRARAAAIAGS